MVYHSQSGGTEDMATAVSSGIKDPEVQSVELRIQNPLKATVKDVLWAEALILGTPENFGYMSGALKYFFDRIYHPCLEKTQGLPYMLFVNAGNDGNGAVLSITRIVTGLRWREIAEPIVVTGEVKQKHLDNCREMGMMFALGLETGVY